VPVVFNTDSYQLGFIDSGTATEDLSEGTKADVPFWLGSVLHSNTLVTLDYPKVYTKLMGNLKQDPMSVSFASSPYYYYVALEISSLTNGFDNSKMLETLQGALAERYKTILDRSQNLRSSDSTDFTRKLTRSEKNLFEAGYNGAAEIEKWKGGRADKLTVSAILHPKKRKRDQMSRTES